MKFIYNDGGRAAAGFKGDAGDCVTRAIAIATEQPYMDVYKALGDGCRSQRKTKRSNHKASARNGVNTNRKWFKDYMASLGWKWTPTMFVGSGCKVHLKKDELPMGRLIVSVSKHYTTVIDGVIHDTYCSTRGGTRCVYGYWIKV